MNSFPDVDWAFWSKYYRTKTYGKRFNSEPSLLPDVDIPPSKKKSGEIDQWDDLSSGVYFQTYDALITVIKTFLNTVIITTKEVMV